MTKEEIKILFDFTDESKSMIDVESTVNNLKRVMDSKYKSFISEIIFATRNHLMSTERNFEKVAGKKWYLK